MQVNLVAVGAPAVEMSRAGRCVALVGVGVALIGLASLALHLARVQAFRRVHWAVGLGIALAGAGGLMSACCWPRRVAGVAAAPQPPAVPSAVEQPVVMEAVPAQPPAAAAPALPSVEQLQEYAEQARLDLIETLAHDVGLRQMEPELVLEAIRNGRLSGANSGSVSVLFYMCYLQLHPELRPQGREELLEHCWALRRALTSWAIRLTPLWQLVRDARRDSEELVLQDARSYLDRAVARERPMIEQLIRLLEQPVALPPAADKATLRPLWRRAQQFRRFCLELLRPANVATVSADALMVSIQAGHMALRPAAVVNWLFFFAYLERSPGVLPVSRLGMEQYLSSFRRLAMRFCLSLLPTPVASHVAQGQPEGSRGCLERAREALSMAPTNVERAALEGYIQLLTEEHPEPTVSHAS